MNGLSSPRSHPILFLCGLLFALGAFPLSAKPQKPKALDIADTITTNRITTQFAAMLQASDMATFLSSRGPFTVFVPTDSAFSKLPPGTLEALLRPENKERLQNIILYYVVNGKAWTSKDLLTVTSLLSCQGNPPSPLSIHKSKSGTQYVAKAKIVHADIRCQNGIIHEIDTLLMPPEKSLPPLAPPAPAAPATNAPAATAPGDTTTPLVVPSPLTNAPPVN